MYRTKAQSTHASLAISLLENLQQHFLYQLNSVVCLQKESALFQTTEWFRSQGKQGGGLRYVANDGKIFNRASINVSHIHYADSRGKSLSSATALSSIIHPQNPYAPSIHLHISWTEMKLGKGYWRIMADLNPAIEHAEATLIFINNLKQVATSHYPTASAQGERYFTIPALGRCRGVSHFYLEEYNSTDGFRADVDFANAFGQSVIKTYVDLFCLAIKHNPFPTTDDYDKQLDYHTLYLFQVLTLDRGTTSGLLAHKQNDLGIMGSLPAFINKALLESWQDKLVSPQNQLLSLLVQLLPDKSPCPITDNLKHDLANVVRQHYNKYPEALALQATGNVIP